MNRVLTRSYRASCASKNRYTTAQEADQARQRIGCALFIYHCQWCVGFHLTRQPQRRRDER